MKFVTAVVMLVLAYSANASIIGHPWAGSTAIHAPVLAAPHWGGWAAASTAIHAPALIHAGHWGSPLIAAHAPAAVLAAHHGPALVAAHHGPAAVVAAHHGPAAVVAAHHAPLALAHSGSYVAANRGSVHSAPLPGHLSSATSLNLQPAPGTL